MHVGYSFDDARVDHLSASMDAQSRGTPVSETFAGRGSAVN